MVTIDRYRYMTIRANNLHSLQSLSRQTRRSKDWVNNRLNWIHTKKSVGVCTCYSSHIWRPSHCPIQLNEQRRSPRLYVYRTFGIPYIQYSTIRYTAGWWLHTHGHLPLPHSWLDWKFAKFSDVKNKAPSKRLHRIYVPHSQVAPHEQLFTTLCGLLHVRTTSRLSPSISR